MQQKGCKWAGKEERWSEMEKDDIQKEANRKKKEEIIKLVVEISFSTAPKGSYGCCAALSLPWFWWLFLVSSLPLMSRWLPKLNSSSLPSPRLPETVVPRRIAGVSLVWKDLTVTIKDKRKYSDKVLRSSTGYALPRTITVIMGPARSGKSTLLRALAGRLPHLARVFREIFVSGATSRFPYRTYDDRGDMSSANMDTDVAIHTLEATYKLSAVAASVEAVIS